MNNLQNLADRISQLPLDSDAMEPPPAPLVGFSVFMARRLRQWKRTTLADFAGVSVSSIERIERGEQVSVATLEKVGAALDLEPGYFTAPRKPKPMEEAVDAVTAAWGNREVVKVAPIRTQAQVRRLGCCCAVLIHAPGVPDEQMDDVRSLAEWLDLTGFVLTTPNLPEEKGRRDLYADVLGHVQLLERAGLVVLGGVVDAPQPRFPDWTVAVISVTSRRTDPGAGKRRAVFIDREVLQMKNLRWDEDI